MPAFTDAVIDADGLSLPPAALTAGTMYYTKAPAVRKILHRFLWDNSMLVALGAVGAGDVKVCTLLPGVVVTNAYVVILGAETSANALTVAVGRVSATYIDYIVAKDAKASAGTVYGAVSGDRGTNLTGYDLPSLGSTTDIFAHFIKTTTNLNSCVGSAGVVLIETMRLP
jgi:hypothetical protein